MCMCDPNGDVVLSLTFTQSHVPFSSYHCRGVSLCLALEPGREHGFCEVVSQDRMPQLSLSPLPVQFLPSPFLPLS